jgi:hypothetical protein
LAGACFEEVRVNARIAVLMIGSGVILAACSSTGTGGGSSGAFTGGNAGSAAGGSGGSIGGSAGSIGGSGGSIGGSGGSIGGSGGSIGGSGGSIGGSGGSIGGSGGSAGSGGSGGVQCPSTFPEFEDTCATADDCVLVDHTTSCCGSVLRMSINRDAQSAFDAAEAICSSQYPACGCAAMGLDVEDGTLIDWSQHDAVISSCDAGSCVAHYTGETFACGDKRCTTEQICWITMGGPSGSGSSAMCNFSGGCTDCSCVGSIGCTCVADGGHVTVTCAAP